MSTATFNDYFSVEKLGPIFQTDSPGSDKLKSRENGYLEFKESFNWGNKNEYVRTIAAFANAKGGYLVFGVTNSPRTLKGLTSDKFENTDTAKITEYLNEYSPVGAHNTKAQAQLAASGSRQLLVVLAQSPTHRDLDVGRE